MAIPRADASPLEDWVPTEVFDWKRQERNTLVLSYTMACPLRCDFCCYACHSGRTSQTMPLDMALRVVEEAAALGSVFSNVGFTGGEPLLYVDEVAAVAERAHSLGLTTTIATAAHWADSDAEADRIVAMLAARGLIRINISHDPSHAEWVPSANVARAAKAASRHGIDTYIIGTFADPGQHLADLLPELVGVPRVEFVEKYIAKVGRAAKQNITQATYGLDLNLEYLACYRRVYHDVVVWYDGKVYPCCSTFNRSTPGICAGNAFSEPLSDIWDRIEGSLMLRMMKRQGFGEVYRTVAQIDPSLAARLPSAADTVGPCSLCHEIFSNKQLTADVKAAFEIYEQHKVSNALAAIEASLGEAAMSSELKRLLLESNETGPVDQFESAVRKTGRAYLPTPTVRSS